MNKVELKKVTKGFTKNGIIYPNAYVAEFKVSRIKKRANPSKQLAP